MITFALAGQPQDGRIRCCADKKFKIFKLPTLIFCSYFHNLLKIGRERGLLKKLRGHRLFKRVNCKRSYRNSFHPYLCLKSFFSARARCMTWRDIAR